MSVTIDVTYQGELICEAIHGPSRTTLKTDAPLDNGGKASTFSPTDLVATALGSCILTIVGLVAQRNGIDVTGARVEVVKEMSTGPVRRIAALTARVIVPLKLSEPDQKKFELAARACPVKQSLHPDVRVDLRFEYPV